MYTCAIANQKGGVGKTTTTQNLGVVLARELQKRVLLIDLDAQGNLTDACGIAPQDQSTTMFEVLDGKAALEKATIPLESNLDLVPANISLAVAELAFAGKLGRENLLKKALASAAAHYDYLLVDCPPSLGLLTVNALTAAHGVLIPVQVEYHALAGLALIQQTVTMIQENLNATLNILGLILTFYDGRKKLNKDVADTLSREWSTFLFSCKIKDNVSLAEAPSNGQDIHTYRRTSYGAADYKALANEFVKRTEVKS